MMMPDDAAEGVNPPDGGPITFRLAAAPAKDAKDPAKAVVKIVVKDASGQAIRTIDVKEPKAGLNRVWWDLRGEPSTEVTPRMRPINADDFKMNPDGTRKFAMAGASRLSVLVPPGTYSVTLTGAGPDATERMTVLKDPNSAGSETDIQSQTRTIREVHEQMSKAAALVNRAEAVRAQIAEPQDVRRRRCRGQGVDGGGREPGQASHCG